MKEETIIRISVRSLVEFILREGDIDNRVSGSMEKDAMLLGGKNTPQNTKPYGNKLHSGGSA